MDNEQRKIARKLKEAFQQLPKPKKLHIDKKGIYIDTHA